MELSALEVVTAFGEKWTAHELDGTLEWCTSDCRFDSTAPAPDGTLCVGLAEIRANWLPIFENTESVVEVEETFSLNNRVVQRWRYSWGTGHVRGVDIFKVRDGKVCEKYSYVKG